MRIVVITSCTGEKRVHHEQALTLADFQTGPDHVAAREREVADLLTPAEELYTGQQHVRLMRGVEALRTNAHHAEVRLDLWILSAGYGLVPADRRLAPYECTFNDMSRRDVRAWSESLGVPQHFRSILSQPYDLALILLGDSYLAACAIGDDVSLGGPTLLFCGQSVARTLPKLPELRPVPASVPETKRFSSGLLSLKGELGGRILSRIATDPLLITRFSDENSDVLSLLEDQRHDTGVGDDLKVVAKPPRQVTSRQRSVPNPVVDFVSPIPPTWREQSEKRRLKYFIPDWDDQVDPDYDFETDVHSGGSGDWSNQFYAHQFFPEGPKYDGILISKVVAEKSKKKRERVNSLGVHRLLRVPRDYPVMGDCGAFGYIDAPEPPAEYRTAVLLDYYTRLDFDLGVSTDHLIVPSKEAEKRFRYDLTIQNAEDFLREHQKRGLTWEPIGAVQGWDADSYAEAARKYVQMGYQYIALGGLVRCNTSEILRTVAAVREVVPRSVRIHLFGLARLGAISDLIRLGIDSIDSASFLRKAWLGSDKNYLTLDGWFSAIRIPQADASFRAKKLVAEGLLSQQELEKLERACLAEIRSFAKQGASPSDLLLDLLTEYDALVAGERPRTREKIRRTLEARPWEICGCAICREAGVEVAIFRGNNRNRRRGFHNTHIFYQLLQTIFDGETIRWLDGNDNEASQMQLPMTAAAGV